MHWLGHVDTMKTTRKLRVSIPSTVGVLIGFALLAGCGENQAVQLASSSASRALPSPTLSEAPTSAVEPDQAPPDALVHLGGRNYLSAAVSVKPAHSAAEAEAVYARSSEYAKTAADAPRRTRLVFVKRPDRWRVPVLAWAVGVDLGGNEVTDPAEPSPMRNCSVIFLVDDAGASEMETLISCPSQLPKDWFS